MENEKKVLVKVEHLEQYFSLGRMTLKAVDDVNFEIYKGEVFGLVGESGCGKTTTGRTIIRLYNATGGNVYFDGVRIVAGLRRYKAEAKALTAEYAKKFDDAKAEYKAAFEKLTSDDEKTTAKLAYDEKVNQFKKEFDEKLSTIKAERAKAKHDAKFGDKDFRASQVARVKEEYAEKLANCTDPTEKENLIKSMKDDLRVAKRVRITDKIQMIFQDPIASLDPRMTVKDIIAEGLIIRGMRDKAKIEQMVFDVLEMVGLVKEHASRYPHEFSGGQRQRIGIARAIIMNPEFIIADEPISALDVSIQAQVINLLNGLREKLGLTIMFIAHDLSVVKYFSDRIAVMYYGHIVELATSDELFAHPLHPYTKSLLSAIPLPDPETEKTRQRITYVPLRDHDYSKQGPTMREIAPGHFVSCNDEEFAKFKKEIKK